VFLKLSDDDKKQFKVVHTTSAFPNQTITVSDRVPQPARHKLVAALAEKPDLPAAKRIFDENSKQNRSFVAASPEDFRDAEKLLEGAAWGW
jgi:ABC-type phosphate/phosphonate transport system substrate-binding protein